MHTSKSLLQTMTFQPRNGTSDGYLFDLDGSERFVRPKTGADVFPIQNNGTDFAKLGSLNAVYALMNWFTWGQAYGAIPSGPIMSAIPDNLQWQITVPGLTKGLAQS